MPLVEVIHAAEEAATVEQKRALTEDMIAIFGEVLGTPKAALRIFFYSFAAEDSSAGLLDDTDA
jgi:phenylpyruvate tautomerase PptA (4-oxalocrotonate tautomerase family)